ncbi:MAG: DUF3137 domain-containing protein [Bacteroidota bacterium]
MTDAQSQFLSEKLTEFEKYRKTQYRKFKIYRGITKPFRIAYIAGAVLLVIASLLPFLMPVFLPFIIVAGALFILEIILHNWIFKDPEGRFAERFKLELLPALMSELYPEFSYKPNEKIKDEAIIFSGLFGPKLDAIYGEDYFEGKINGIGMRFSELNLKKKKYGMKEFMGDVAEEALYAIFGGGDDFGDEADKLVSVFRGLYFHLGFHVDFKGSIIIQARQSKWRKAFKKAMKLGREIRTSGDAAFDQVFEIYTSPGLELEHILIPAMRTHLLKLQASEAPDLAIALRDGQMFVAMPWQKDLLEAELAKGIPSLEDFSSYIEEVELIKGVVKEMY